MGRWVRCSIVALVLIGGLAACSDDNSLGGSTKRSISEFRAVADSVCARGAAEAAGWRTEYQNRFGGRTPTAEEAKAFLVEVVLPQADKQVGDLHDVGEPTLDRTTWDSIMRDVDASLSELHKAADTDPVGTAAQVVAPVRTTQSALEKRFEAFGAKECAKPS